MRVLLIDQQVQHLGQGQPGYQGFQVDENNCSSICRSCVFPSGTEGMNHGTESRLPDGSGAMPSVNQLGLDFARTMPQFPFQSPWDSSGISRWFLLAGCHNSKSKLKPDGFQVIVDGLYQVFPDPDRYFMAFPQYLLFTLPVPTSVTSPLHLQPWDPSALGRWDTIPPRSGIFCRRRLHPGRARNMGQGQVD